MESALTTTIANIQRLTESLPQTERHLVVAFSGGVDSTLLLLAANQFCQRNGGQLTAVHVHHGLSPNADDWLGHCQAVCTSLGITLAHEHVSLTSQPRQSLEALAREARYSVLLSYCRENQGVLLLGQHSQDQLETVLLQLKRGAGPKGLAGMGEAYSRTGILILRPMLTLEKPAIEQAVRQQGIHWVEDESNSDNTFDRNFLRNQIIPALTERWPQIARTVARSASLCAEQDAMLDEETQRRLTAMLGENGQLKLAALGQQSSAWQRAIIRLWLDSQSVATPGYSQLEQIVLMLHAREDAQPQVSLGTHTIRRFDDALYAVPPRRALPEGPQSMSPNTYISLPWLDTQVKLMPDDMELAEMPWRLQTGMPAVRIKPEEETLSKPLKQWLKLWKVPVWQRAEVAVIYCGRQPAALLTRSQTKILQPFGGRITLHRKPG